MSTKIVRRKLLIINTSLIRLKDTKKGTLVLDIKENRQFPMMSKFISKHPFGNGRYRSKSKTSQISQLATMRILALLNPSQKRR